jgi:protein gp37
MSAKTQIQWTSSTWNPIVGCSPASSGCAGCYAVRDAWRMAHNPHPSIRATRAGLAEKTPAGVRWTGLVRCLPEVLDVPLHWGKPRRVFVCSQSDLFHDAVPEEFIAEVFAVMALTPRHTYQVLTKRPRRMAQLLNSPAFIEAVRSIAERRASARRLPLAWSWPLPNVEAGVSIEDQDAADARVPSLLATPAAVRWLSCEPLLGPVNLRRVADPVNGSCVLDVLEGRRLTWDNRTPDRPALRAPINRIGWVVCGGEAGPRSRPMHPDWARGLRMQCSSSNVPYFFKSWGDWRPNPAPHAAVRRREDAGKIHPWGESRIHAIATPADANDDAGDAWLLERVGKGAAGRELDGRTWDEMPARVTPRHDETRTK